MSVGLRDNSPQKIKIIITRKEKLYFLEQYLDLILNLALTLFNLRFDLIQTYIVR